MQWDTSVLAMNCRYLYKLGRDTNFPLSTEAAAELDKLTIEEVEAEFR